MVLGEKEVSIHDVLLATEEMLGQKEVTIHELENVREAISSLYGIGESKSDELELIIANLYIKEAIIEKENNKRFSELLEKAKKHFYIFLTLFGDNFSSHYGLLKIAVLEEDYLEAIAQLQACENQAGEISNFHLMYQMLTTLLGKEDLETFSNREYIQNVKVDYEPLLSNYHLAESAFEKRDYQRVKRHLSVCENLAKKKEISIDFSPMIFLAHTIFSLYKENQKKGLQMAFSNSSDIGERMLIVHKLLELDEEDFESNFLYMDAYIDLKAYNPLVECIERLNKISSTEEERKMVSLYGRLISEVQMESDHLKVIHAALNKGRILQLEAFFEEAINCYEESYSQIPFPYFQLQKAEVYYEIGDLDSAEACCNRYLNDGYLHYVEASILLYKIYRTKEETDKAFNIALECYKKARMKERGISLNDWIIRLNNQYNLTAQEDKKTTTQYLYQGFYEE